MKMRLLAGAALSLVMGCASATSTAEDGGVDLAAGECDQATLFATCADQCHEPVCVVSKVMCVSGSYVCDCASVQPCGPDMRPAD